MSGKLEFYLDMAGNELPTIPEVAARVMRVVDDPNSSVGDLRALIDQDVPLAANVLRVANSALYGFSGEIPSLPRAIALIGSRAVRNLVLSVSMKSTFRQFGLMERLLWTHSTLAGPVTAALARHFRVGIDLDEAFTAGLLHDVGKNALANSHRDGYEEVVARVYNEKISFVQAERDHFGFDHAELGARVAERWKLPEHLITAIRGHHDSAAMTGPPDAQGRLTALVAISTACLTRNGVGRREPAEGLDLTNLPAWRFLCLREEDVDSTLELCIEQVERARALVA